MLQAAVLIFFPACMIFAAISDLFTMTISNRLSLGLLVLFFPLALLLGLSLHDIAMHVACGLGVLALTFTFFAFGWIGGGDAKLAAATAVWVGAGHLAAYGVYASLLGGALTLVLLAMRSIPMPAFALGQDWAVRLHDRGTGIPYGIALAAAGLLIYPETALWHAASTLG